MNKTSILTIVLSVMISLISGLTDAEAKPIENQTGNEGEHHNWQQYSTHHETVDGGSRTRTCDISYKLKLVIYYCDVHDHTDSEIYLEETIHGHDHG